MLCADPHAAVVWGGRERNPPVPDYTAFAAILLDGAIVSFGRYLYASLTVIPNHTTPESAVDP